MSAPAAGPWTGVWLADDLDAIRRGVENGAWVDASLGVAGAGLDGLAAVIDPVGVLLQCGVAWIIEHVRPLSEALDRLAGDPAGIASSAQTWRNVAADLQWQAEDVGRSVRLDLAEWTGAAADRCRDHSDLQQRTLQTLAAAAGTMAAITEGGGSLVAAVRLLVRDAIAVVVSRLIVSAAQVAASAGMATPLVIQQVTTLIGTWTARIGAWLRGLLASLRNLMSLLDRAGQAFRAPAALNRVRKRGAGPIQRFDLTSVRSVAGKYGIDISPLSISLGSRSTRGICGRTRPDGSVVLFPTGFRSEEDLARTLVHERFHHDELAAGRPYPRTDEEFDAFEDLAYAYEEWWWNNQPIRPEPRIR